jgi:hypothetical protein
VRGARATFAGDVGEDLDAVIVGPSAGGANLPGELRQGEAELEIVGDVVIDLAEIVAAGQRFPTQLRHPGECALFAFRKAALGRDEEKHSPGRQQRQEEPGIEALQ